MFRFLKYTLTGLALISLSVCTASAQQTPAPTPRPESDFVTDKGFKSKVLDVKYRDPGSLANVLKQLGSGFKGATISANSEFKTITVRDFPENLASMEEALKRLDVPGSPRANIELHMHILIASNSAGRATASAQVPAELKDVLTQLRETLNYKDFEVATSVVQRLTESRQILRGKGTADISASSASGADATMPYEYYLSQISVAAAAGNSSTIRIEDFYFHTIASSDRDKDSAQIQTALNLRDGEKVVVGTATMRDRALIIVLTAKFVN